MTVSPPFVTAGPIMLRDSDHSVAIIRAVATGWELAWLMSPPETKVFPTREEALAAAHERWRTHHLTYEADAEWLSTQEAGLHLGRSSRTIRERIRRGQWPLGHARFVVVPGRISPRGGRIWQVTRDSVGMHR